ncbi:MAG: sigma-70 family RNA polymerase sigma factor [Oscillospiraceae bacterium]|nr:sigma-70 family RNA polymerase sigma factor [Oscillospiraceae bacterium]
MTEQELRLAVNRSQKEGFRLVFQQYYPYVYRIVWNQIRAVGTKEDAEECVSDIFTELFAHFDDVEEGALQGFIGILSRRRAINQFQRLSRTITVVSLEEEGSELTSDDHTEENAEANLRQRALYQHIRSLGEPDAGIIILRYIYGCNSAEIGRQLNMNPITVRVRLKRALNKLKKLLADDSFFSDGGEV